MLYTQVSVLLVQKSLSNVVKARYYIATLTELNVASTSITHEKQMLRCFGR